MRNSARRGLPSPNLPNDCQPPSRWLNCVATALESLLVTSAGVTRA